MTTATSPRLPGEPSPGRLRADTVTVMLLAALAAVATVALTVREYLSLFTSEGISWNLPVRGQRATAEGLTLYGSDGPVAAAPVSGTVTHLRVVVADVNTISSACLAIALAVGALTALVVIGCTARLAWLFLKGRSFTLQTSRALRTLTASLLIGGLAAFGFWHMGANGVEAALDVRATASGGLEWWGWYCIVLFAITSLGLLDLALRRAIRLQHETEGLV